MNWLFIACVALLVFCWQGVAHNYDGLMLDKPLYVAASAFPEPLEYEENRFRITENLQNKYYLALESAFARHVDGFSGNSFNEFEATVSHKIESYTKRGVLLTRLSGVAISGNGLEKTYLNFADVRLEGRFRKRGFYLGFFSDDWVGTEWFTSSFQINNFGDSVAEKWVLQREYIGYVGVKINYYNVLLDDAFFGSIELGKKRVNGDGYSVNGLTGSAYVHFRAYKNLFLMGYGERFTRKYRMRETNQVVDYIDYYAKVGALLKKGARELSLAFFWGENQNVAFLPLEDYKLKVKKRGFVAGYSLQYR